MFHLEGIESDDLAIHSDSDEPLTMRRFGRRSSSISAGDESSNSYSSNTATSSTEEGIDMISSTVRGDRDQSQSITMKLNDSPTIVNFQRQAPTSPIAFNIPILQPMMQKSTTPKMVASKTREKSTGKRMKSRRDTYSGSSFSDLYYLTGEFLGQGAYATVETCVHRTTGVEYAVKIIQKRPENSRTRVIKEIETFHLCSGHPNIVQFIEYFEEDDKFYLIFEKLSGGPLLNHIQRRICFTEHEACLVVRDIVNALKYLHDRGIAHRDVKPENILCTYPDHVSPVKLCDLDLASKMTPMSTSGITTPELQSPVGSAEFMAPEVVDAFIGEALSYDKRCDLWSLGVILYIMLCGYPPFYGECERDDCGWDRGLPCQDCQESLFSRIQTGEYDFPQEEWAHISDLAKDLISHLLVKDASRRYTVDDVIRHNWLNTKAPTTPLMTPGVLLRNDSARDFVQLAGNFDAMNRWAYQQRISNHGRLIEEEKPVMLLNPVTVTAGNGTSTRKLTPIEQFKDLKLFSDRRQ